MFSFIIPVYKAEHFLHRTINSVISQTESDWELILVDDGSPDNSGAICDNFANIDKRIRVIHKQNEGVSVARNTGIEHAKGTWCCFIDSDDWIEPTYLENFNVPQNQDCQLILQSFIIEDEIRKQTVKVILPNRIFENSSSVVEFLEKHPGVHNGFIWHRLFNLDIIKNQKIQFPPGISFAEDGWFFFDYMQAVRKTACTSAIGNHYIIRTGSLTSKGQSYPFSIYKALLEHYISSLLQFNVSEDQTSSHTQMVKRYACRLASSWCIANAVQNKKESILFIEELRFINEQYDIYNVKGLAIHQRLEGKIARLKAPSLQIKLFKLAIFIKKYEEAIRRRLLFSILMN